MRVVLDEDRIEVRLAAWEKALGLLGNIRVAREHIHDARVVREPMREVVGAGMKAGLRLPGVYYVARNLRLDEAFIIRRGIPALSFAVEDGGRLKRVLVSTPRAAELARELQSAALGTSAAG